MVGGTASAGGLESTDRIYVSLVAQNEGAQKSEQIYYALVGPNQEGIVDHKFSVVLESAAESVRRDRRQGDARKCHFEPADKSSSCLRTATAEKSLDR